MIQWYPGHMAKAIREINEKIKLVDVVIVLLDARIPRSSFNPELKKMLQNKRTLYVLNKKDKADDMETTKWLNYYKSLSLPAIAIDSRSNKDIKLVLKGLENIMFQKRQNDMKKGLKPRPIRTMIVGIPNVGKSTLINGLVGKKATMVGDKPGVTKNQQWIRINQSVELLDTPGVLWSKFENENIGYNLAITGAIKDDILPLDEVGMVFIDFMNKYYPESLNKRYNLKLSNDALSALKEIAEKENIRFNNKELDLDQTAKFILVEFRNNMYGKITLDRVLYEENN
ncbi:MAG: ribosome biogenesis GTPase YlqF [Bacilli bacterium]|nr:ribosome biogenesis GTPase YlqF [Bacilli bacterium]